MNDVAHLRSEMLTQVMMLACDEISVLPFLDADPGTPEAHAALGRLVSDVAVALNPGDPLVVFCAGGDLCREWRNLVTPNENSLWSRLSMLDALYGHTTAAGHSPDPYEKLCELQSAADADFADLN